jgi:hypothetical protein
VVERLPSKQKALNLKTVAQKKKKKNQEQRGKNPTISPQLQPSVSFSLKCTFLLFLFPRKCCHSGKQSSQQCPQARALILPILTSVLFMGT